MADVDIFIGNTIMIDVDVYQLWLNGHLAHEAAQIQQKRGVLQKFNATFDMLLSDTLDHYRTFALLEPLMKCPSKLSEQCRFQIPIETQNILIEKYYEFDQSLIREFLGKKMNAKMRSNLDDLSEKTRVPLRSCRRQFDNVKQVFKTVEEMRGSLVENIKSNFLLSDHLAQQYAAIVFMANHKFETSKKKLQYLTFHDFVYCSSEMIQNWSYSSKDCRDHEDMDVDLDRDFLLGLRELKVISEKDIIDEHKIITCKNVKGKLSQAAATDLENNFRVLAKILVNIAYGLNHHKELRDFFLDLVEKVIEPCKTIGWTTSDLRIFLSEFTEAAQEMDFFIRIQPSLLRVWERYMTTSMACILQMYHT